MTRRRWRHLVGALCLLFAAVIVGMLIPPLWTLAQGYRHPWTQQALSCVDEEVLSAKPPQWDADEVRVHSSNPLSHSLAALTGRALEGASAFPGPSGIAVHRTQPDIAVTTVLWTGPIDALTAPPVDAVWSETELSADHQRARQWHVFADPQGTPEFSSGPLPKIFNAAVYAGMTGQPDLRWRVERVLYSVFRPTSLGSIQAAHAPLWPGSQWARWWVPRRSAQPFLTGSGAIIRTLHTDRRQVRWTQSGIELNLSATEWPDDVLVQLDALAQTHGGGRRSCTP